MSGSASPPLTSLTSTAPALDRGRSATAARMVSTLTAAPAAASAATTGQDPAQLLLGRVDPLGAGPGRLAADVDEVGALGDQLAGRARPRRPGRASGRRRRTSPASR